MTIEERIFQIDGHELILRNANEEDAQMLISGLKLMCGETRFLAKEPDHPTVALCYEFQIVSELPTEEFDIPVDLVLWA